MTDKEKLKSIKAKIERLFEKAGESLGEYRSGAEHTLITLNDFINSLPEEPVSDDLEVAKKDAWFNYEYRDSNGRLYKSCFDDGFEAGAQWQFNQLEKNRIAACDRATKEEIEREQDFCEKIIIGEHRQPTFSDAIEYGIKWQKEQMKKNTIRGIAHLLVDRSPYEIVIKAEEIQNLKHGTLVKFIIIK